MFDSPDNRREPPAFNVPAVILWLIVVLLSFHVIGTFLTDESLTKLILLFALIPARYAPPDGFYQFYPGGWPADVWTLLSYSFLHATWMHIVFNLVWLLAFGTPVARRLGTIRFLIFYAVCAVAGAVVHLSAHAGEMAPVIGASAAVSGLMGGAARFVFLADGPLGRLGQSFRGDTGGGQAPRAQASLRQALSDPRVLIFVGVWIGLNLLFGTTGLTVTGETVAIAWEAHLGGFAAGLLLFGLFDPIRRSPSGGPGNVGYGEWRG